MPNTPAWEWVNSAPVCAPQAILCRLGSGHLPPTPGQSLRCPYSDDHQLNHGFEIWVSQSSGWPHKSEQFLFSTSKVKEEKAWSPAVGFSLVTSPQEAGSKGCGEDMLHGADGHPSGPQLTCFSGLPIWLSERVQTHKQQWLENDVLQVFEKTSGYYFLVSNQIMFYLYLA